MPLVSHRRSMKAPPLLAFFSPAMRSDSLIVFPPFGLGTPATRHIRDTELPFMAQR